MILSCSNISKSFNEKIILKNASFHIEDYDKAAIVGINGSGKSTLLKIIVKELNADDGIISFSKDKTLGYLSQQHSVNSDNSIFDELLSVKKEIIQLEDLLRQTELDMKHASGEQLESLMNTYSNLTHLYETQNGYSYRSELIGVLKGLGFEESEFDNSISTLSGGQKTRVALGKLLLLKPDLIILDEPTNHLDMSSITWLETYLLNYKGAVLIVSHDRYFLDRITNKIIEIDNTEVTSFTGNYTDYTAKKENIRITRLHSYAAQQREMKHQEDVIVKLRSFNREKSIKRAESREKMLAKIDVLDKPKEINDEMNLSLTPHKISGNDVLTVDNLSKFFGDNHLFSNLDFEIKRGEHVAILGDNGTGKTTILKIINQLVPASSGTIKLGANVFIGYYDQEHQVLHLEKTLFEEISDSYPDLTNTEIRNTLAAFLFTNDDVFKRIKDLSGGERGRVSLAKLMLSESNFLILDEPTNHLDLISKGILENAINAYTGTVLYVSHDRYFVNKTASRILDLHDSVMTNYIGNYDYYLEKKTQFETAASPISKNTDDSKGPFIQLNQEIISTQDSLKNDWQIKKEFQAMQRKNENDLKKCEDHISEMESAIADLERQMTLPENSSNVPKLQEFTKKQTMLNEKLSILYEQWETLFTSFQKYF